MPVGSMKCRICDHDLVEPAITKTASGSVFYQCNHCGPYRLSEEAEHDLDAYIISNKGNRQFVPYAIRQMQDVSPFGPLLKSEHLEKLFKEPLRPSPQEQADSLIKFLGDGYKFNGHGLRLNHAFHGAIIGTLNKEAFAYLARLVMNDHKINITTNIETLGYGLPVGMELTFDGWNRYEKLMHGAHSGMIAFMAMQFGDPILERVVSNCFKPAAEAAGFALRKLDDPEHQRAGLIDDRLRNEIKASRFIISDLTHANNGAYWEAGYAEGLGKPVIYTCEQGVFNERQKEGGGTHFDTNHHLHILWGEDGLDDTAERLKACIRATIPEAQQE